VRSATNVCWWSLLLAADPGTDDWEGGSLQQAEHQVAFVCITLGMLETSMGHFIT
jgi:hypothetical protein